MKTSQIMSNLTLLHALGSLSWSAVERLERGNGLDLTSFLRFIGMLKHYTVCIVLRFISPADAPLRNTAADFAKVPSFGLRSARDMTLVTASVSKFRVFIVTASTDEHCISAAANRIETHFLIRFTIQDFPPLEYRLWNL